MTDLPACREAESSHYYNEIDPHCAQWIQNLMDAGEIPRGVTVRTERNTTLKPSTRTMSHE